MQGTNDLNKISDDDAEWFVVSGDPWILKSLFKTSWLYHYLKLTVSRLIGLSTGTLNGNPTS